MSRKGELQKESGTIRRILKEHKIEVLGVSHGSSPRGEYVSIRTPAPPASYQQEGPAGPRVYSPSGIRYKREMVTLLAPHIGRKPSDILIDLVEDEKD